MMATVMMFALTECDVVRRVDLARCFLRKLRLEVDVVEILVVVGERKYFLNSFYHFQQLWLMTNADDLVVVVVEAVCCCRHHHQ